MDRLRMDGLGDTLGQDDGHLDNEREFLKKERDLPPLGQFTGEVHTRTMKDGTVTTTDEILLYHDQQQSGPIPYSVYYGIRSRFTDRWDSTGRGTGGYRAGNPNLQSGNWLSSNRRIGASRVEYRNNVNGRLSIHTRALSAEETALFASTNFPSQGLPNQIFTYGTGAGQRTLPFDGTFYNGVVEGKYNCTAGACTIARDSKGETLRFDGTWTFTPTERADLIMLPGLDHDTDYLVFGYWVETKTGQAPVIRTLVSGSAPFGEEDLNFNTTAVENTAIAGLTGTATYKGRAFGRYGLHEVNPDGSVASGSQASGLFQAKTTLTANFGGDNEVAPNDQFAITGRVTDFKPFDTTTDAATSQALSAWTVELQRARFRNGGEYSSVFPISRTSDPATRAKAPTRGMTGTTPGATPGNWVGRFFGPTGAHPTGVTGAFDANFTNGNVRGAFGATRE